MTPFQCSGVLRQPIALLAGLAPGDNGRTAGSKFVLLSAVSDFLKTAVYFVHTFFIQPGSLPSLKPGIRVTSVLVSKIASGTAVLEL